MLIKNHTIQNITVKYTSTTPDNVVLLLNSTDGINLPTNIIIYYPPLAETLYKADYDCLFHAYQSYYKSITTYTHSKK